MKLYGKFISRDMRESVEAACESLDCGAHIVQLDEANGSTISPIWAVVVISEDGVALVDWHSSKPPAILDESRLRRAIADRQQRNTLHR